jgi:uncharacterized protein
MAESVLADSSFLIALLNRRDADHAWATVQAERHALPWLTCDAVLSETFFLLQRDGASKLAEVITRGAVKSTFQFTESANEVLNLMKKFADVPMSFADACLVRMSEMVSEPLVLTTDSDFRTYRRHGRQAIPCVLPR